jgi:hypothetical protein
MSPVPGFLRLRLLRFFGSVQCHETEFNPSKKGGIMQRNTHSCMGQTDPQSGYPLRQAPICLPRYTTPQRAVPLISGTTTSHMIHTCNDTSRTTTCGLGRTSPRTGLVPSFAVSGPLRDGWPPLRAPTADPGTDSQERPRVRCSLQKPGTLDPKPLSPKKRETVTPHHNHPPPPPPWPPL